MTIVLLDGCGKGYRLRGRGSAAILIPPVAPAALTGFPPGYRIAVSNARSRPANRDSCDIHNELLALQWFGNRAEIRIKPDSYFPAPGDQKPEEVAPRVYLDTLQNIQAFRRDLQDRVVNGYLRSDESQRVTRRIAESFPLAPGISNLIRFGGGGAGFIDLTPDLRLKVVTPVRGSDTAKEITGYEIAYYRITSAPTDARVKISFDSASTSESKEAPANQPASAQPLAFPASFRFYRLVFRRAISSSDHLATILSAEDEAALNEVTRQYQMKRDPSCEALSISRATCMTPAATVAVNLGFTVSVNDKQVFVPLGELSRMHCGQMRFPLRYGSEDCSEGACVP
jgi:hypothetical protein